MLTQHPHPFYQGKPTTMGYALRTARWRYVEWRDLADGRVTARELYDLERDPAETLNQAKDPARAATADELAGELCFYESGRPGATRPNSKRTDWPYARLTLARFNLEWLGVPP